MADLSTCPPLTRASVVDAHALILPFIHRTPVLTSRAIDALASTPRGEDEVRRTTDDGDDNGDGAAPPLPPARPTMRLWFKCENLQRVGAFKARGAFHAVERLKREPGWEAGGGFAKGVVTHSSGNHAQALALAASTAGMPAHIVMPGISAKPKVAATRGYGANVVFSGSTAPEREVATAVVMEQTGARLVPPYDHPDIILGQGTVGLELQAQVAETMAQVQAQAQASSSSPAACPTALLRAPTTTTTTKTTTATMTTPLPPSSPGLDAIIAPCGGGGLLAGVVLSAQGTGVRVFGAEPTLDGADDAARGLRQGRRVEHVATLTIADGLRTPVGVHNFAVLAGDKNGGIGGGVDGMFTVSEDEIRAALRLLLERLKVVVEPSAAVPLAVALFNDEFRRLVETEAGPDGWDVGIVLSGGNVDLDAVGKLLASSE